MDNIKITLTSQRKLITIESENFRIRLNGKTNADYKAAFKVFGVELVFEEELKAEAETDVKDARHPPFLGLPVVGNQEPA